jgi:hypothetical protein
MIIFKAMLHFIIKHFKKNNYLQIQLLDTSVLAYLFNIY